MPESFIRWRRMEMRDGQGVPYTSYYTDDKDWRAWSIDQSRQSNGSRTFWSEWQPRYHGEKMGARYLRLRDAKAFVKGERPDDHG